MQVDTHLLVHFSAFLDFGRWILAFLQSFCSGVHTLDNVCGIFDRVSSGCCGAATSIAPAPTITENTIAAAAAVVVATLIRRPLVMRAETDLYLFRNSNEHLLYVPP